MPLHPPGRLEHAQEIAVARPAGRLLGERGRNEIAESVLDRR
ncbi:MAG: hypothetical protein ACTH31_06730 [Pseudoclavibacter sp.]